MLRVIMNHDEHDEEGDHKEWYGEDDERHYDDYGDHIDQDDEEECKREDVDHQLWIIILSSWSVWWG